MLETSASRGAEREEKRRDARNGYYERDYVTRMGTIRLKMARTREKKFLPRGLEQFQRRAEEVSMLIARNTGKLRLSRTSSLNG